MHSPGNAVTEKLRTDGRPCAVFNMAAGIDNDFGWVREQRLHPNDPMTIRGKVAGRE